MLETIFRIQFEKKEDIMSCDKMQHCGYVYCLCRS